MQRRQFFTLTLGAIAMAALPNNLLATDHRSAKPSTWTASTVNDAITAMYGSADTINNGISVNTVDIAQNGGAISVNITSDIKNAKTLAVFQDANPESAVAVFDINEHSILDFDFKIKMKESGTITAVIQTHDGKLYSGIKKLHVSEGGCDGG